MAVGGGTLKPRAMDVRASLALLVVLSACGGIVAAPADTDASAKSDALTEVRPPDAGPDCGCRNADLLTFPLCPLDVELTQCPRPE